MNGAERRSDNGLARAVRYGRLTRQMMDAAAEICQGRLALTHEGGYSEVLVPFCGMAVMEELSGIPTPVREAFTTVVRNQAAEQQAAATTNTGTTQR